MQRLFRFTVFRPFLAKVVGGGDEYFLPPPPSKNKERFYLSPCKQRANFERERGEIW
jgi:hypothetical protein